MKSYLFSELEEITDVTHFEALIIPVLANGSPFELAPVSFWYGPIRVCAFPCYLGQQEFPGSCMIPVPDLESTISPKDYGSF